MKHHRYHELDSLRAVAAIGVICWHYVHTYRTAPFGHLLAPFYGRGMLLVDFFFVLSGFVLARAFWTDERGRRFAGNVRARLARIYPLHLLTLCWVAAMQWYLIGALGQPSFVYAYNDGYHFLLNLSLLNNSGLQERYTFNGPAWSISTEFLVNLAFLAVIACPRKLARCLVVAVLFASLTTMAVRGVISGTRAFGWIDNDLVRTFAGFFVGVALYSLHRRLGEPARRWPWDAILLALGAAVFWYLSKGPWTIPGDVLTCYVAFPLAILAVVRAGPLRDALRLRPMVALGEMSYSIYLVHFPLMLSLHLWTTLTGTALPYDQRWFFVAFIAAILAASMLSYRWVEEPGKRWLSRRSAEKTAVSSAQG